MKNKEALAALQLRASEIRRIAKGVFDKTDRSTLLTFVDDCERIFADKAGRHAELGD